MNKIIIKKAAKLVREKLETLSSQYFSGDAGVFFDFPKGCCDISSVYLGKYLIREKICQISDIMVPDLNNYHEEYRLWSENISHSWLVIDSNLIVDITADQFGKEFPPIFVANSSAFHSGFKRGRSPYTEYDPDDETLKLIPFEKLESSVMNIRGSNLKYIGKIWNYLDETLPNL